MTRSKTRSLSLTVPVCLGVLTAPAWRSPRGLSYPDSPSASAQAAPLEIEYRLRLLRPTTHLLEVEIVARRVMEPVLDFVMPAWSPGRYAIYDLAKNVQEFKATGAQGQDLPWRKVDKQTWQVDSPGSGGAVRVSYRVYANDLDATFSQFDPSHANVNGAAVFMNIAGHKSDPLTLEVEASASWKVISGFSESLEQKRFQAGSYDLLVDTPLEISPEASLDEFHESGKTFRVAVHTYTPEDTDRSRLIDGLRKIVRSEMAMMPSPDFQQYTFIFHFAPDLPQGDGMEHLNSTEILVKGSLATGSGEALEIASHEFFHLWNVKRLRPAALGPFDYTRENYTRSLWFAEGITSYYGYRHLLRSGILNREEFLKRLADEIRHFQTEPGRELMSAESSSFNAWFYDRPPQMQETNFANSTISYYNKGALLGMLLDLELRARSGGRKSLDDVLVSMYRKFYEEGGASPRGPDPPPSAAGRGPVPYGPARGRGYEEKDILDAVNAVSGSDFSAFFERYVRGTEPLPYDETLARVGLELRVATSPGAPPSIGVLTRRSDRGIKIVVVRPGGAADRAGLSRDDLLTATDDVPLEGEELRDRLKFFAPGNEVPFTVERHGRQQKIIVTLDPPIPDLYTIQEAPEAAPAQVNVRKGWLGK